MPADSVNRETARDAFTSLLSTALTGESNPVEAVYGYQVGDFQGKSPVVVVSSAGSERKKFQLNGQLSALYLTVFVFVLYSDGGSWGEDDAEDRIDLIEKEINDVIRDNRKTSNWVNIELDGRSKLDSMPVGGSEYRREVMTVKIEVLG